MGHGVYHGVVSVVMSAWSVAFALANSIRRCSYELPSILGIVVPDVRPCIGRT